MKRRSFLFGSTTAGIVSLSGCLGDETDGDNAPTGQFVETEIDPDAQYVVRGPEGRFSAKGPLNTDLDSPTSTF